MYTITIGHGHRPLGTKATGQRTDAGVDREEPLHPASRKENAMTLKERMKYSLHRAAPASGFQLEKPKLEHYQNADAFRQALRAQKDAVALMDADEMLEIGVNGEIGGTDWRLSHAAFSDLCNFSKTPATFLKSLAKDDEQLALDVVASRLRTRFHTGQKKVLVLDTRYNRVEGIVGKESYTPISNFDVFDFTLTAAQGLEMSNGWLSGPNMRLTALQKGTPPIEPQPGDVVNVGISAENAIHGDASVLIMDYLERLVCTNGMLARDNHHMERIIHRGDVEYHTQKAVVTSAARAELLAPALTAAAKHFLDDKAIDSLRAYLRNPRNGGNDSLDANVTRKAVKEAVSEGRPSEEVTLWNFTNAITEAANEAPSLQRRNELEAMGYRTLVRFGAVLAN